jgi:hypothetical protein
MNWSAILDSIALTRLQIFIEPAPPKRVDRMRDKLSK